MALFHLAEPVKNANEPGYTMPGLSYTFTECSHFQYCVCQEKCLLKVLLDTETKLITEQFLDEKTKNCKRANSKMYERSFLALISLGPLVPLGNCTQVVHSGKRDVICLVAAGHQNENFVDLK